MLGLLHLPPVPSLVILFAIMALIFYAIVSTGSVQPLEIVGLVVIGFAVIRLLFRLWHSGRESRSQ